MTSNNDSALHNMAGSQMREERAVSKSQILDDLSFEVFQVGPLGMGRVVVLSKPNPTEVWLSRSGFSRET